MDNATILGLLAGACTTIAFFPQLIKTWKSKSTKDVSLHMYIVFCIGIVLWLLYGLMIHSTPVIIANAVTLVIASMILLMKIRYR